MNSALFDNISKLQSQVPDAPIVSAGRLVRGIGLTLEAIGCQMPVGSQCLVQTIDGQIEAEVVGFAEKITYIMPTQAVKGIVPGSRVQPLNREQGLPVGMELLGRVVDGNGQPLDGLGPIKCDTRVSLSKPPINPLSRKAIDRHIDVGVRAVNAITTVGLGQRMGLFAGSGVGKSVLMGMMTRGTSADIVVVGLVGERGREVKEFIHDILGDEERKKSVVVAAPADTSPLMRLKGCEAAVSIAEYFRDKGLNVLLLIDSLTRYAMAQREIALAVGEPPATKGYPPSVFTKIPSLVERAGTGKEGQGSITAFYTVLTEGDDLQDPIADSARAILDGHIVLSRDLADAGHYPAIDIQSSISRVMPMVCSEEHMSGMRRIRQVYSNYQQNKDLISIGAYTKGTDPRIDLAIAAEPAINAFLQQGMHSVLPYDESLESMIQLSNGLGAG